MSFGPSRQLATHRLLCAFIPWALLSVFSSQLPLTISGQHQELSLQRSQDLQVSSIIVGSSARHAAGNAGSRRSERRRPVATDREQQREAMNNCHVDSVLQQEETERFKAAFRVFAQIPGVCKEGLRLRGGGHNSGKQRARMGRLDSEQIRQKDRVAIAKKVPLGPGVKLRGKNSLYRSVAVPPNRYSALKQNWQAISRPIVQHLKLQIRMNLQRRVVELRTCDVTADAGAIERAAAFISAFTAGFSVEDAQAMLRLEGLYIDSFHVTDVKNLKGDHLSRAIGRIAGTKGRTKAGIEASTRTRLVLADKKVSILGSADGIAQAKNVVSDLVLGRPTAKANRKLSAIASRLKREM